MQIGGLDDAIDVASAADVGSSTRRRALEADALCERAKEEQTLVHQEMVNVVHHYTSLHAKLVSKIKNQEGLGSRHAMGVISMCIMRLAIIEGHLLSIKNSYGEVGMNVSFVPQEYLHLFRNYISVNSSECTTEIDSDFEEIDSDGYD